MKKATLMFLLLFAAGAGFSQGYLHFQPDAYIASYSQISDKKVLLSMVTKKHKKVLEYDLSTKDFIILNDSTLEFKSFVKNGSSGVAISSNNQTYFTNDNWKTITESAQTGFSAIYKTSNGFLALKEIDRFNGEFYHSADGNNWTKTVSITHPTNSNFNYRNVSVNPDKIWLIGDPRKFYVSYDGGRTFQTKQPAGVPATMFSSFSALDSLTVLAAATNGDMYRTNNGGISWTTLAKQVRLVETSRIDSLIANHHVDGLLLSTDTGTTWTKVFYTLPEGFSSAPVIWNRSENYYTTTNGNGFYYTTSLSAPWQKLTTMFQVNRTIAAKGNTMIAGGQGGRYAYSRNNGRTFIPGTGTLGSEDLFASEVINDTLALMADRKSNIFVSKDGGATWQQKCSNGFNFIGVKFRYSTDLSKIILRRLGQTLISKDGGNNWEILGSIGGSFDMTVTPSGKILAVCWYSDTMRISEMSLNGNRTDIKLLNENLTPMGIEMFNDNIGYCFGVNSTTGQVHTYKTTDGWSTFTLQGKSVFPAASPIVHMPGGADTIYVNFRNTSNSDASINTVYQTYNGGVTWSTNTIVHDTSVKYKEKMQAIHFFNAKDYVSLWDDNKIYFNRAAIDTGTNPSTFVREIKAELAVNIYPNPARSIINIESQEKINMVEVYDFTGKLLLRSEQTSIDISALPAGIYMLNVSGSDKTNVSRMIKQ